jgi:hypothetical protein
MKQRDLTPTQVYSASLFLSFYTDSVNVMSITLQRFSNLKNDGHEGIIVFSGGEIVELFTLNERVLMAVKLCGPAPESKVCNKSFDVRP